MHFLQQFTSDYSVISLLSLSRSRCCLTDAVVWAYLFFYIKFVAQIPKLCCFSCFGRLTQTQWHTHTHTHCGIDIIIMMSKDESNEREHTIINGSISITTHTLTTHSYFQWNCFSFVISFISEIELNSVGTPTISIEFHCVCELLLINTHNIT